MKKAPALGSPLPLITHLKPLYCTCPRSYAILGVKGSLGAADSVLPSQARTMTEGKRALLPSKLWPRAYVPTRGRLMLTHHADPALGPAVAL